MSDLLQFILVIIIAFIIGKLMTKIKMPAILGWLITGMLMGPHALNLLNASVMEQSWYENIIFIFECSVGIFIGSELVWKKIKKTGKQIVVITLTQSLGTFIVVTLVFGIVFYLMQIPLYLAVIFGGIALATAPAPALSIIKEYETDGPVSKTLIPMAALDDIVGVIVFLTVISFVSANLSTQNLSLNIILLFLLLPLAIGVFTGFLAGKLLKKERSSLQTLFLTCFMILVASTIGFLCNAIIFNKPILNFMLIGMTFSATFANMVTEKRLENITKSFQPILAISLLTVILNLGAPLDYHLIYGAGFFTFIYIISRAAGKILGASFGAKITNAPLMVKKYLGLTLLPHSGVSLVFTGIAVSILKVPAPECAQIIQGTIAAAAVINEFIAVFISRQAFKWSGEIGKAKIPLMNN